MASVVGFQLRGLALGVRLGIVSLCLVLLIGLAGSLQHMKWHHENRDERAGLSLNDIQGAYHGVSTVAPLRRALERGHPESMPDAQRRLLLDWLLGKADAQGNRPAAANARLGDDYDNPDLGDNAPAEIIRANCLQCHARAAATPMAKQYPLETWDDVRAIAISREIKPTDERKLIASIHAHALSLGCLLIVIAALAVFTRWPRGLVSFTVFFSGLGLLADFVCQWLARDYGGAVWGIVIGGAASNAGAAVLLVAIIADLLLPRWSARA